MFDFNKQVQCGDFMCQYLDPEKLKGIDCKSEQLDDFDTQLQAEDVYTNNYTYVTDEDYTRDEYGCAWNKKGQIVYFSRPVQLSFYDKDNNCWVGGIGFQDYIICGCCGASIWLPDFYEDFAKTADPIQVFSNENWVDISDAILG